ncbi:hypothetical protein ARALYDRAFT_911812 [Arabidopsis lyrata subsp. lyrata]|uniref:Uncharacterized protein n=1 Tax=Arabidopsis lyrata subsp. lyrata TaxID=81972 RepID=D7M2K0_ARALL|nr:hypothetical protein ARALYDRAFT_911812 [Arabidopsis lyrata subsp. lyrata]
MKKKNGPKQNHENKDFHPTARRRGARSVTMKISRDFIRCSRYLHTLCVIDQAKADKLAISSFSFLISGCSCLTTVKNDDKLEFSKILEAWQLLLVSVYAL